MFAKVVDDCRWTTVKALGGLIFNKRSWTRVPNGLEKEAMCHQMLEVTDEVPDDLLVASESLDKVPDTVGYDASRAAQDLADEHGLDLAPVEGSGKDGKITINDVRALLNE